MPLVSVRHMTKNEKLTSAPRRVAPLIARSQSNKARLLHYFPSPAGSAADDACGTHIDHSLMTGLCAYPPSFTPSSLSSLSPALRFLPSLPSLFPFLARPPPYNRPITVALYLALTLGSAMYLQPSGGDLVPVPPPSPNAGLWIYPREAKEAIKVQIPADCLGELMRKRCGGR